MDSRLGGDRLKFDCKCYWLGATSSEAALTGSSFGLVVEVDVDVAFAVVVVAFAAAAAAAFVADVAAAAAFASAAVVAASALKSFPKIDFDSIR